VTDKPILLWDAGPGEIRAGLIESGVLNEFRIIRLRRDTALLRAGERYTVRLTERLGSGQAMVDLGSGQMAILQPCPKLPIGALIEAEMTRAPIPEPGRWKLAKLRPASDITPRQAQPGWHFSAEPWELALQKWAPQVAAILCPDTQSAGDVERLLGGEAPPISVNQDAISEADFDTLIDNAVGGDFLIAEGALRIERTRAMTMIDVDGTAPALTLNLAAAREIPRLLRLLDLGGPIGVDFVSMTSREERLQVASTLDTAAASLGGFERTAINGYGFCQLIRPRIGPSILETLCGTRLHSLSNESRAVALLREAGRSTGFGPRQLVAPPAIIDLIKSWPEETGALRFSLGVAIELVPDTGVTGYGHVHVAQA
jgi:ribonuclease G